MKIFNKILCLFCLGCFFISSGCLADNSKTTRENKIAKESVDLTKENSKSNGNPSLKINEEGYELPDLAHYKLETKQTEPKIKSPKPVSMSIYSPKIRETFINTTYGAKVRVLTVKEFEVETRKFCYIISVTPAKSENSNVEIALMTNLIYYDLDGDGKFETQDNKFSDFPTIFPK